MLRRARQTRMLKMAKRKSQRRVKAAGEENAAHRTYLRPLRYSGASVARNKLGAMMLPAAEQA